MNWISSQARGSSWKSFRRWQWILRVWSSSNMCLRLGECSCKHLPWRRTLRPSKEVHSCVVSSAFVIWCLWVLEEPAEKTFELNGHFELLFDVRSFVGVVESWGSLLRLVNLVWLLSFLGAVFLVEFLRTVEHENDVGVALRRSFWGQKRVKQMPWGNSSELRMVREKFQSEVIAAPQRTLLWRSCSRFVSGRRGWGWEVYYY